MSKQSILADIANRAETLRRTYPATAERLTQELATLQAIRNNPALREHEQDALHAVAATTRVCRQWTAELAELSKLVAKHMPGVYKGLHVVGQVHDWHSPPGVDWDKALTELREIESAARAEPIPVELAAPPPPDAPPAAVADETVSRLLHLVGDGMAVKILSVARQPGRSANDRMMAVVDIDRRCEGYNSVQWADLLDVTADAVRQTEYWKSRKQRREWR